MRIGNQGREAENAAAAYRLILLIRRFEEKAGQLYAMGLIPDEIKLCIGREALYAGLQTARHDGDPLVVGRRCHGTLLAFGLAPELIMRELVNPTHGLFDRSAINADNNTQRPADFYRCAADNDARARWALSLAMARSLKGAPNVVFVILDGDTFQHDLSARSLDLAYRFQLPIVFIIDHATPDIHPDPRSGPTPADAPTSQIQTTLENSPFGFASVDGIDAQAVAAACYRAGEAARSSVGSSAEPHGLMVSTQAFRGHANLPAVATTTPGASTDAVYDPVQLARVRLVAASEGRTDTALAIEKDVRTTLTTIGLNVRAQAQL